MPVLPTNAVPGHRIPTQVLDEVFAGPVGGAVIGTLRAGQHSRRMVLLKVLRDLAPPDGTNSVEAAWEILVEAERRAPDVVREILDYPSVGAWLVQAIRKVRGIIEDKIPNWVYWGYLNSVAAAAAIRAGIHVVVDVPVWQGRVSLPTVGQFHLAGEDATHMVRLRVAESTVFVEAGENTSTPLDEFPSFALRAHRSTAAGQTVRWTIDDIDPFRTFAAPEVPRPLDDAGFRAWCGRLDEAWAILVAEHPAYVPEVSATEPVIVPVPPRGSLVAASSASSFGAICLTPPASPAVLAETIVHELQHSKLNALLDLVPLQEPGSNRLCYAPWRRDPRPLSGLLHGIYAFTGVVEYWRQQWPAPPGEPAPDAVFAFAHHREQVHAALAWLGDAPELTDAGVRFVDVAAARLAACDEVAVPEDVLAVVAVLSAEHRLAWHLRHTSPSDADVAVLVERRLVGARAPARVPAPEPRPDHRADTQSGLAGLLTMRAVEPDRFAAGLGPAAPGEAELARGDRAGAVPAFAERIRVDPDDDAAWVGLLIAAQADDLPPATVVAAYGHIRRGLSGAPPDPVSLVDWFAGR